MNEHAIHDDPAMVVIRFADKTMIIRADIEYEKGADGGLFPVVKLLQVQ